MSNYLIKFDKTKIIGKRESTFNSEKEVYSLDVLTFWALPTTLIAGWIIHLFWMLGFGTKIVPFFIFVLMVLTILQILRKTKWNYCDLRWAVAPICVLMLAEQLPWWEMKHIGLTDGMYHLIQANHYIGESENLPIHQGQDFLFRPPIIPAVISMELIFSDSSPGVHHPR